MCVAVGAAHMSEVLGSNEPQTWALFANLGRLAVRGLESLGTVAPKNVRGNIERR